MSTRPARYCELHIHSCHSLLDGVPTPEQIAERAAELGLGAVALTDHDSMAGLPALQRAAQAHGLKAIAGAELTMEDGSHLTLLAETRDGYANLCRLITASRLHTADRAAVSWTILRKHSAGLIGLTGCRRGNVAARLIAGDLDGARRWLSALADTFDPGSLFVELHRHLGRDDVRLSRRLAALAAEQGLPIAATGNAHYLAAGDAFLQSALVSIRERVPLPRAGHLLRESDAYFLRSASGMAALFADLPEAVSNTVRIAERCESLNSIGAFQSPAFPLPAGSNAGQHLKQLCFERLLARAQPEADAWHQMLVKELARINRLGLADYFLTLWDAAAFCQRRGILFQGSGAVAATITARLLGLSASSPSANHLAAFDSVEHGGAPDFRFEVESAATETLRQYLHDRWGFEHVESGGQFVCFTPESARREAAFALDLPPEAAARTRPEEQALSDLARRLTGRIHALAADPETLVVTRRPVSEIAPVQSVADGDQTAVQFSRAALQHLAIPHLSLRGSALLSAISETLALAHEGGGPEIDLDSLSYDDKSVYDSVCSARTLGLLNAEAGSGPELIPCIQPRSFQDLLVEASLLLRPSPLRGRMVQHYRQRRLGLEPGAFTVPFLRPALEDTLGVLIFEEQALRIVREVGGFDPAECEAFRQALSAQELAHEIDRHRARFCSGARQAGYPPEAAEQVWNMLAIFAGCSVSRAQAAGLAVAMYRAAWLRLHYPAHYFCGQLRRAPPGTHAVRVLEAEAARVGVKLLAFDVNRSKALPVVERGAIRMGLRHIAGIDETTAAAILAARGLRPFRSLADLIQRTRLPRQMLEWLVLAGALDSFGERPHVLWELAEAFNIARRPEPPAPDYEDTGEPDLGGLVNARGSVFASARNPARLRLTELRRDAFTKAGCLEWKKLRRAWIGSKVKVGGLVVAAPRRAPPAGEDYRLRLAEPEGAIEVVIPAEVYWECREALRAAFLIVEGRVTTQGEVVTVAAGRVQALA